MLDPVRYLTHHVDIEAAILTVAKLDALTPDTKIRATIFMDRNRDHGTAGMFYARFYNDREPLFRTENFLRQIDLLDELGEIKHLEVETFDDTNPKVQ